MSEENVESRLAIAKEAKRLLSDPLFNGVLAALLKDYLQQLMASAPGSPEGIVAHSSLNALDDIKKRLRAIENDGVVLLNKLAKSTPT